MDSLQYIIPGVIVVIGAIVHIEVSIATLRNDVKWIKRYLNAKER